MLAGIKSSLRDAYAHLLAALGLSGPHRFRGGDLLILTFHRVLPAEARREYPLPGLAVTPEELRWILATLTPHFDTASVSECVRRRQRGSAERPLLALSFDDGQWDNLAYAAPILAEFGVPATFYLPTDFIGSDDLLWHDCAAFAWRNSSLSTQQRASLPGIRDHGAAPSDAYGFLRALKAASPEQRSEAIASLQSSGTGEPAPPWARLMSWNEARALRTAGHEIGSHGCSHGLLPQMEEAAQRREIVRSRQLIAEQVGQAPTSLCYPNGDYDSTSLSLSAEAGYENAVTTRWGLNRQVHSRFELLRCDVDFRRLLCRRQRYSEPRLWMRLGNLQPGLRQ